MKLNIFIYALLFVGPIYSQVLTEPQNRSTTNTAPKSTTIINQEPERSDQPFLGTDVPIFNPGTEVFSWDGQNWNINNNRLMIK